MIVRYDQLDRLEKPIFSLCNPGSVYQNGKLSKMVGILVDTEAEEIVFNFNATSELNLRVNMVDRDDAEENAYTARMFKDLMNRRLIFVEGIGYFVITEVKDGYSDMKQYKDINAKSVDIEISQKMLPYFEPGTYRFRGDSIGETIGLIDIIASSLPLWTVGHIDGAVSERWRTFEDVDTSTNCLSFMLQDMQDAYECIFIFDIITRTINIYDQTAYVDREEIHTDIHITKDDFVNSLDVTENADDLYTAVSVFGDDDITIAAINPLGTTTIYDFSYYYDWMSDGLRENIEKWQASIEQFRDQYYEENLGYYEALTEISNLEMEVQRLDTQITMYSRCRDNIVAGSGDYVVNSYNEAIANSGGDVIVIEDEIEDTLAQIDSLIASCNEQKDTVMAELEACQTERDGHKEVIESIHRVVSINNYFSEEELDELSCYIFEGKYTDEYVTITDSMTFSERFQQMKILYDRAATQLTKCSRPTQEFSVDTNSFLFTKEFQSWSEQLVTGCLINVELDADDIAELFLSNITVNYDDRSMKMTFGNRYNRFDPKSLFNDMLGNISKSANTLELMKNTLDPLKNGELDKISETLSNSRNLTMDAALASTDEDVVIDASGYTGRRVIAEGTYDPRQVKLVSNRLVFTDDDWGTCRVAIGEIIIEDGSTVYGVNAEALLGQIIIGERMTIGNKDNTLTFNDSGLTVTGSKNSVVIDPSSSTIISVTKGTESLLYLDENGDLHISGDITATSGTIGGCAIDGNGNLQIKNVNIAEKLTADSIDADGINAENVTISGNITATRGTIGGCSINSEGQLRIPAANIDDLVVDNVAASSILVKDSSERPLLSASGNSVVIGGWKVDHNSLYSTWSDSSSRVFMCTGTASSYTIGGYTDEWYFGAGSSSGNGFGVSTSGKLYASGATISGSITASTGKIGDWEIKDAKLYGATSSGHEVSLSPVGVVGYYEKSDGTFARVTVTWEQILTAALRWNE